MEGLKSGVVLCKVANLVKPGVIASKKIKVPSPIAAAAATSAAATSTASATGGGGGGSSMSSNAFGAMDNVAEFLNACKVIGVKEQVSSSSFSSSFSSSSSSKDGSVMCVLGLTCLFWYLLFSFDLFCVCCVCRTSFW